MANTTIAASKPADLDLITRYLDSILNHIRQGLLFVDTKGNITTYNASAERMLGLKASDLLQCPYWDFFDDQCFGFSMRDALTSKHAPQNVFAAVFNAPDKLRDLEITATYVPLTPLLSLDGLSCPLPLMNGLIVLLRDVTEIRRLENLVHHNDRMKEMGAMASMVAHEIRNPLGGIKGFAALLCRELEGQSKLKQMSEYILEGAESLNSLVTQVLNYSRPLTPHFESTNLAEFLKEVQSHVMADEALKGKSNIAFTEPSTPVVAPIDAPLMRRALLNLILNGIQAMPEGGTVTLSLVQEGDLAVIKVEDKGVGIPPENLKRVFTPFFTTKAQGNGFGLPEVHNIIRSHAGYIFVDSTPGIGTTFLIKIPLKVSHGY